MHAASTLEKQLKMFAQHLRDPAIYPAPAVIEERRLKIYRDLFFNNIENLLAGNFPVIKKISGHIAWPKLVRDFFRDHHSQTPLFTEIGREFIQYIESRQGRHLDDPPWLLELAHYEWVELALELAESEQATTTHTNSELTLNPLAWPLAYQWPVHRISLDFQPNETPDIPTFLLVMRDRQFKIRFIEISALSFRLLQHIGESENKTSEQYLQQLGQEANAENMEDFMHHGQQMLQELITCGAITSKSIS
jgi:uncharacterized protein